MAGELTVKLSSRVQASAQRVFEAMTDPNQVAEWWGPEGFTCPEVTLDVRVGGAYRIAMQPPEGELFHLVGEYVEVSPPSHLAYTFAGNRPTPTTERQWPASRCAKAPAQPRSSSPKARSQPKRDASCTRRAGPTPLLG